VKKRGDDVKKRGVSRARREETRSQTGRLLMPEKRAKGSVAEGEAGKKAKATQHAGGQSVSEKSQATRTSNFGTSLRNQTIRMHQYINLVL
jgi:hypothetical protein